MAGRLILVRHGLSAHVHTGAVDRAGVQRWRDAYDAAGIQPHPAPPPELVSLAAGSTHVIASDLLRAIESARLLAPNREIRIEPMMRESPMPIPRWPTQLPLGLWGGMMYAQWSLRRLRGVDVTEPDWSRAEAAARWLGELVADGSMAVVVTHGVFRQLLSAQLARLAWKNAGRKGRYEHWSAWMFQR